MKTYTSPNDVLTTDTTRWAFYRSYPNYHDAWMNIGNAHNVHMETTMIRDMQDGTFTIFTLKGIK